MNFKYLIFGLGLFLCSCSSSTKNGSETIKVDIPSQLAINANKNVGLNVGDIAPEIRLPDAQGNLISLNDFRGKYVLIDFWAAWCGPCRGENPNNVRMYKEYKDKGFEIFGVSLDRDRDKWNAAVKYDKLTWTQVSDLSWWESEVVPLYQIRGIPHTVLIDKEGRIVEKNLRGINLEIKLKEIFGG